MPVTATTAPRLTELAHGGGCGCKIAPGVLARLLQHLPAGGAWPDLMVGSDSADDAAVWRLNDEQALIATTDFFMPIVDDAYDFGRIAAANALSDVYAMGGRPIMALAIVGMPINVLPHETIARVLEGGAAVCAQAGIPVAGGHSIDSVEPVYGLAVMGLAHPDAIRRNTGARAGDVLVLGKPLGVGVYSAALKQSALDEAGYAALVDSTTRLNRPGPALAALPGVHGLTDVTGFGLAGHALEMARGAGVSLHIDAPALPWLPGVHALAGRGFITGASGRNWQSFGEAVTMEGEDDAVLRALIADPQTSGGLLVSCAPEALQSVLDIFHGQGFAQAAAIGTVHAGPPRVVIQA
ncbi:MAG: selenide, water dikinase SelD [Castellaniella sp.]